MNLLTFPSRRAASRSERLALAVILVLALVLRFRYITLIEHNVDHAYPVWQALNTLETGHLPLVGQGTSVLFSNPALTGYLFLPVVALTRSPLGVYVFVIALNTLAVWFAYRASRALLGVRPALVAAALMAVNPWVIEYSRTSWVQSLLPFFVCAVAWLLWPVLMRQARNPMRRTLLALAMMTLLTQTYLLAFIIIVPVGLLALIFHRRLPKRALMMGAAVFAAATALYAVGLLSQWDDVRRRMDDFSSSEARLSSEAWDGAVRLVTGAEYEVARGVLAPADDSARRHDLSRIAHYMVLGAIVLGMGAAVLTVARGWHGLPVERDRFDAGLIALIWFGVPVIAMTYTGNPVHPFYQLMGLPAGYALAAWGIALAARLHTRTGARLVAAGFIPFALLMSINSARYYQETAAIPGAHDLTALPVGTGVRLGQMIDDHLPQDGMVYAEVETWVINSFSGRVFPTRWDNRAPAFNYIPREGGVYVKLSADEPTPPAGTLNIDALYLRDGTIIHAYRLLPAAAYRLDDDMTPLEVPSEQGLTLLGYGLRSVSRDDGAWELATAWRVDGISPEVPGRVFGPFAHVFDADGQRFLIVDGQPVAGSQWRVGDVHVHRMPFTVTPGTPFSLLLGQYDGMHNANVIFLPRDAAPTAVLTLPGPDTP